MKNPKIKIEDELKEGKYSNFVRVAHTPYEFLIDFGMGVPEEMEINISSRIIMSPSHTKAFLKALEDNIRKYETSFGAIPIIKDSYNLPFGEIV